MFAVLMLAGAIYAAFLSPAAAARLTILDYQARNDPNQLLFTPRCNARLSNEILPGDPNDPDPAKRKGDAERIREKVTEFAKHPAVNVGKYANSDDYRFLPDYPSRNYFALCLSSAGGDLMEALKIARLFRDWMLVVEADERCYSACALIFMRGQRRLDGIHYITTSPGRYLHHGGRLGFHSPALRRAVTGDKPLDPVEVAEAYSRALRTMRSVLFAGSEGELGEKARAPRSFLHKGWIDRDLPLDIVLAFLTVPPEEMFVVSTINEAMRWGIEIYGLPIPRALTENMLAAACINTVALDCDGEYCSTWGGEDIDAAMDADYSGPPIHWDESWQRELMKGFRITRLSLMPKPNAPGPLFMQAFRMVDRPDNNVTGRYFCQIETAWLANRMLALDITTFGQTDPDRKAPSNGPAEATMKKLQQQAVKGALNDYVSATHLPVWKLLPGTTKLSDIAKSGWGWLDAGPNFFDKAPPLR